MSTSTRQRRDLVGLLIFLGLCLSVYAVGGAVTATSVGTWYPTLAKPSFNPPDWVFAPVWTVLYLLMAIAGWRAWRAADPITGRRALLLFAVQLGLNLVWSILFFGLRQIGMAMIEILVLLLAVSANTWVFGRIERWAGALLVPYVLWVAYAAVLNAAIWALNRS